MRKLLFTLFIGLTTCGAIGQQGVQFSQYIFNAQAINPAWFNHRSPISGQLISRVQWLNYDGVPNTHAVMGQYNIGRRHTVGLIALNDHISVFNKFQISGTYAYRINLGKKAQLAFGTRVGYSNSTANIEGGYLTHQYDPVLYSRRSVHHFSIGAGMYASGDRFFVGISAPDLFNNGLVQPGFEPKLQGAAYHLHYGVKVYQSIPFMFYPTMLVSVTPNAPLHANLDLNFLIQNGLWLTLGASTDIGASAGIGYLFENNLRIVYSFGFALGPYTKYGGGVHELTIGYTKDLFKNDFEKRKFIEKKGNFQSYKKQRRKRANY